MSLLVLSMRLVNGIFRYAPNLHKSGKITIYGWIPHQQEKLHSKDVQNEKCNSSGPHHVMYSQMAMLRDTYIKRCVTEIVCSLVCVCINK